MTLGTFPSVQPFPCAVDVSGMIGSMSHPACACFIQITDPGQVTPGVRQALIDCWIEVANAGGAVGFAFPPVDASQAGPVADRLIADLDPDYNRVLLAEVDGVLAGWLWDVTLRHRNSRSAGGVVKPASARFTGTVHLSKEHLFWRDHLSVRA
jgi:hypothetical protein